MKTFFFILIFVNNDYIKFEFDFALRFHFTFRKLFKIQ